jgi:hypothetical protein
MHGEEMRKVYSLEEGLGYWVVGQAHLRSPPVSPEVLPLARHCFVSPVVVCLLLLLATHGKQAPYVSP